MPKILIDGKYYSKNYQLKKKNSYISRIYKELNNLLNKIYWKLYCDLKYLFYKLFSKNRDSKKKFPYFAYREKESPGLKG